MASRSESINSTSSTDSLTIESPGIKPMRVPLERQTYRLGRASANELSFPEDSSLSREHLIFERTTEGWTVRDLFSRNGTQINSVPITKPTLLAHGDKIAAGHLSIYFDNGIKPVEARLNNVTFIDHHVVSVSPTVSVNLKSALEGTANAASPQALERSHLQVITRASRLLAGLGTRDKLFELVLDLSLSAVKASRGVVMTADGSDNLQIRALRGEGFRISTVVADLVIKQAKSLLIRDALLDENLASQASIVSQEIRSILAVPLQTDERVIGLLYLDSPRLVREFTPEELNLITIIANIAAIRIEHAQLWEKEQARKLLDQDLERAAEIQRKLLPSTVPQIRGFDCAGYNAPCRTVGGDYYDFLLYPDGRIAILIGDVSGKGLGAALLMSSLQARAQVIFSEPENLAAEVVRLNRSISSTCPGNCFITFFIAVLDPSSAEVIYCNAGHNPPLLLRLSGELETLEATGIPLGISPAAIYEQKACYLNEGDMFVLFSDGVTEACRTGTEEEYGEDRLVATARRMQKQSSANVIKEVKNDLLLFNSGLAADDITLVVARKPPL